MSKAGLDNRPRNKDGEISGKHGNTLIRTLRKVYGQNFAAGYPETEKLSEVLLKLNETSLRQLRRDHETIWSTRSPSLQSKARARNGKDPTCDARFAAAGVGRNPAATRLSQRSGHCHQSRYR
jgi:hypothetical protein